MTDNEIIEALEFEIHLAEYVDSDYCSNVNLEIIKSAHDLITRQQAEIGKLNIELSAIRGAANSLKIHYEKAQSKIESLKILGELANKRASDYRTMRDKYLNAKSKAVKECLAKVKNYIKTHCNPYGKPDFDYDTSIKILNFIDKLAKEMVGEDNA